MFCLTGTLASFSCRCPQPATIDQVHYFQLVPQTLRLRLCSRTPKSISTGFLVSFWVGWRARRAFEPRLLMHGPDDQQVGYLSLLLTDALSSSSDLLDLFFVKAMRESPVVPPRGNSPARDKLHVSPLGEPSPLHFAGPHSTTTFQHGSPCTRESVAAMTDKVHKIRTRKVAKQLARRIARYRAGAHSGNEGA